MVWTYRPHGLRLGRVTVGFTVIGPTLEKGFSMPQTHVFLGLL